MTSSPESNLRHIGCYGTWNATPLITKTTQLHKEHVSLQGQCKKMCCILDVDDVNVSDLVWVDVSSLLTFVLEGALD